MANKQNRLVPIDMDGNYSRKRNIMYPARRVLKRVDKLLIGINM